MTVFLSQVLNEVVIDRGPSSYLCNLDLYIEGHLVTSVLGDGEEQLFFFVGEGGGVDLFPGENDGLQLVICLECRPLPFVDGVCVCVCMRVCACISVCACVCVCDCACMSVCVTAQIQESS